MLTVCRFFPSSLILIIYLHYAENLILKDNPDYDRFREILRKSKNVLIITGGGISVDSGIPTFLGPERFYRDHDTHKLMDPATFGKFPSLVWEFHNYHRELIFNATPNQAHYAIAEYEQEWSSKNQSITVITQNIDELHTKAGSKNVIELRRNLFKTKCTVCGDIQPNYDNPVCEVFQNKSINPAVKRNSSEDVPVSLLPRCKKLNCNGLLRPHIVWLSESVDQEIVEKTEQALERADVCLVVGVSSVVMPTAEFTLKLAEKGVPVAEFNRWTTLNTKYFQFHFNGECSETVPRVLMGQMSRRNGSELFRLHTGSNDTHHLRSKRKTAYFYFEST